MTRHTDGGEDAASLGARSVRIPWSADARTALVVGAAGGGKSTFARSCVRAVGGRMVQATSEWGRAEQARTHIDQACTRHLSMLVIDDAQHVIGTPAEEILETIAAECQAERHAECQAERQAERQAEQRVDRLLIVSRVPPGFDTHAVAVITAPDLALSLDDVVALFTEFGSPCANLEQASRVRHVTAGWPELVHRFAAATTPWDASSGLRDSGRCVGDFAAAWFEDYLRTLGDAIVEALTDVVALPTVDLATCTRMLGTARATLLVSAFDNGMVMHTRAATGERALPPLLRRHLLERMEPERRRAVASSAAAVLCGEGQRAAAADALAAGELWRELSDLLADDPTACRFASHWADLVPHDVVQAWPAIADAAAHARARDRVSLSAASGELPGTRESERAFAIATWRMLQGDAAAAVRGYERCLRNTPTPRTRILARLALAVIRAPIAGPGETAAILVALERDALDEALDGLARLVRGVIAATSTGLGRPALRCVVDELQERSDPRGALLIRSIDLLIRGRRGEIGSGEALSIAAAAESVGEGCIAVWARAAAALAAASAAPALAAPALAAASAAPALAAASAAPALTAAPSGAATAESFIRAARAEAIRAGLPGPRALAETAAALMMPPPARAAQLARAQALALQAGLVRIPPPWRTIRPSTTLVTERAARWEVRCFGGFRLRIDGADADLRGVRPQAQTILRILALGAGAPVHRDLLADLVWGGLGGQAAVHALHVSVSSLRRMLPAGRSGDAFVERAGEAYRIALRSREDCDMASFDDRLADAANAKLSGDAPATRDGLADALELYVGDILPEDGPAEWVVATRERYRLRAAEAASALAHVHFRLGDIAAAVLAARRAVEIDPWVDASWRTLIAMHDRAGDVIETRHAEDGYRRMRQALGVDDLAAPRQAGEASGITRVTRRRPRADAPAPPRS